MILRSRLTRSWSSWMRTSFERLSIATSQAIKTTQSTPGFEIEEFRSRISFKRICWRGSPPACVCEKEHVEKPNRMSKRRFKHSFNCHWKLATCAEIDVKQKIIISQFSLVQQSSGRYKKAGDGSECFFLHRATFNSCSAPSPRSSSACFDPRENHWRKFWGLVRIRIFLHGSLLSRVTQACNSSASEELLLNRRETVLK